MARENKLQQGILATNNDIYNVTVSPISFNHKPSSKKEFKEIQNSLIQSGMTISQMVEATNLHYTIAPSTFINNERKNKYWSSQSCYYLDFDNKSEAKLYPEHVIQRFSEFGIVPSFYYETMSSTSDHPKFRLVLCTDCRSTDSAQSEFIRKSLLNLFPEADPACKDASRLFYGGNNATLLNDQTIPFELLVNACNTAKIGKQNRLRKDDKKRVLPLKSNNKTTRFLTDSNEYCNWKENYKKELLTVKSNKFDFSLACTNVRILNDLLSGNKRIRYEELLGIVTNLYWTKGGISRIKKAMIAYNNKNPEDIDGYQPYHFALLTNVKDKDYLPMKLEDFSPYPEDHQYSTIINAVKNIRGQIEYLKTEKKPLMTLDDAIANLHKTFEEVLMTNDNNIHIIVAHLGIGKTNMLAQMAKKIPNWKFYLQTHKLIKELSDKITTVEHKIVPEYPTFIGKALNKRITDCFNIGDYKRAYATIVDLAYTDDINHNNIENIKAAKAFIKAVDELKGYEGILLSTHAKGVRNTSDKFQIYDEDPINNIFSIKKVLKRDLRSMRNNIDDPQTIKWINEVLESTIGEYKPMNASFETLLAMDNVIDNVKISSNAKEFLAANYYMPDPKDENYIDYVVVNKFAEDQKVIILSGTPQIEIYKLLYPGRVKIYDISNVVNEGKVIQYTHKSYSRSTLKDSDQDEIRSFVGDIPIITFKKNINTFNDAGLEIYYGRSTGSNDLTGQDICVLGTPHINEIGYKMIGAELGIDVNADDCKMSMQKVEWNGLKFRFNTYENPHLRAIQLRKIESELLQAIARARGLRHKVTVTVFSNFALSVSNELNNGIPQV